MKTKMPRSVTLGGTENVVVINDIWNTIKNWGFAVALIFLVLLFCEYGFSALFVVLAIATAIFGGWMVYKQKAPMGKIGACAVLAVMIAGLLIGSRMSQKPISSPVSAVHAVSQAVASPSQAAPALVPTTTTTAAPAPQVTVNLPDHLKVEVEEKDKTPPADPTAGMTPEERRQYEIWVLRK